jgi:hypothetical protein
MMTDPQIPIRAPRHWLEYITTAVAVIVSLSSLWVAIGSERANRQMVEASSWPMLEVGSSNVDPAGHSVLLFNVTNAGVGPAKVLSFEVFYKHHPYRTAVDLIHACCKGDFTRSSPADTGAASPDLITGGIAGSVIRAGENRVFITLGLGAGNEPLWRALNHARNEDITYRICYCSVFDECWINSVNGRDQLHPAPVERCPLPPVPYTE